MLVSFVFVTVPMGNVNKVQDMTKGAFLHTQLAEQFKTLQKQAKAKIKAMYSKAVSDKGEAAWSCLPVQALIPWVEFKHTI